MNVNKRMLRYLSHHMFPIDESFKSTHCCRIIQWEDILGLNWHRAQIGVLLENDDLKEDRDEMRDVYFQCLI